MTPLPRLLLAALLLPTLAACGGADGSGSAAPSSADAVPSVAATSPIPSAAPSVDVRSIELDAQGIGVDVGAWSVDHDFRFPADQAEFEKVKLRRPLPTGSKAGYKRFSAKKFQVCVTASAGGEPTGWAIFDSVAGTGNGAAGAPTADFCP